MNHLRLVALKLLTLLGIASLLLLGLVLLGFFESSPGPKIVIVGERIPDGVKFQKFECENLIREKFPLPVMNKELITTDSIQREAEEIISRHHAYINKMRETLRTYAKDNLNELWEYHGVALTGNKEVGVAVINQNGVVLCNYVTQLVEN